MMTFAYRAINLTGQTVEGNLDAADEVAAIGELRRLRLSPVVLTAATSAFAVNRPGTHRKRLGRRDIMHLTGQLAALLRAGLPLAKALQALEEQAATTDLRDLLAAVGAKVREGQSFSETLAGYPQYFSGLYRSMVKAGEIGGILDQALVRMHEMMEKDDELRGRVQGALIYPAVMFVVMIAAVAVLMTFVVPRFTGVFADMGTRLPLATRGLLAVSGFCVSYWWLALLAGGAVLAAVWGYARSSHGRPVLDRLKLGLPLCGPLMRNVALARLLQTLGSLLRSGVVMLTAIDAVREVTGNAYVERVVDTLYCRVQQGGALSDALREWPTVFPPLAIGMIATGEKSGNLPAMLASIGDFFAKEAETRIRVLTTLLEPLIIIVMGLLVGFIIVAMMLPIFEMTTMVK